MAQTVGPLTALLCYIKSDRRFSEKWSVACKRAMAHFPDIDTVLTLIREKDPTEIRPLITLLADIALIVTTRQANRMFPPPAAFSYIFTRESTSYSQLTSQPCFSGKSKRKFADAFFDHPTSDTIVLFLGFGEGSH